MPNISTWKKRIRVAVLALLALDVVLFWFNWQVVGAAPEEQEAQLKQLRALHENWENDLRRVEEIRSRMGQVERECRQFFDQQFLSEEVGSSIIVENLTSIASRAGLEVRSVSYKPQELEKRRVIQVDISPVVEGNYSSMVTFINGLERSERFYVMESLGLASSQAGMLKLNLQLRTYFRVKSE